MKNLANIKPLGLSLTLFVISLLASNASIAAAGGNGNGNSGGVTGDLSAVEAELAELQMAVEANAESIAALGVNTVTADCGVDAGALQAAIDDSPAAGAIINVTGSCSATSIIGRTNLLIDGGAVGAGNGIAGTLSVDASRNIQLTGLTIADTLAFNALTVANNSSVFVDGDVTVQGSALVEVNSSLVQISGTFNVSGEVNAFLSGQVQLTNGSIGGASLSRSSSLILFTDGSAGANSITVNGDLGSFSGSHILIQSNSASGGGPITVTGSQLWVQRLAAVLVAGDNVYINVGFATVRQNSVLDVISMLEGNFNAGTLQLLLGSGSRLFFSDGTTPVVAVCDGSVWTTAFVNCGP